MFTLFKNCVTCSRRRGSRVHPPHPKIEILLDNYLEDDLQKFLHPLNIFQCITFSHRYCISDNFITSNGPYANCFSLLILFCYTVVFVVLIVYDEGLRKHKFITFIIGLANFIFCILGVILNFIGNIVQSNTHTLFVLTIRRINKSLNFSHDIYRKFIISNWIYVITIFSFYVAVFLFEMWAEKLKLIMLLSQLSMLLADLNMIYAIRMIRLVIYDTVLCMQELERYTKIDAGYEESTRTDETNWKNTVKVFRYAIDISHVYRKLFEISIFHYLMIIFMKTLADVQAMIVFAEFNFSLGISIFDSIKYIIILILICFGSENFIVMLKNAQVLFLRILSTDGDSGRHEELKALYRSAHEASAALAAGGLVPVGAPLPLALLSVIVTYTVVLLQFAMT